MFSTKQKILTVSLGISIALIVIGLALGDVAILGNLVIISAFISVTPFFLYKYSHFMWIKSLESQFPNFVRDLADSKRSGMSLPGAIRITKKTNYGKLTPEIEKMSNRLSWGTPVLRTLEIFGYSVKDSKIITEAINIIKESYQSGGKIEYTLESLAADIVMIKEQEAEKTSMVRQHVMLMYGIFYMFMAVSIIIIFVMVPMIKTSPAGTEGSDQLMNIRFDNPCENSGMIFPCGIFDAVCSLLGHPAGISCYYLAIFFTVTVIQGLLSGLIAGQLGESSVTAGTKHSLIMVFSAIGIFFFLAKAGILPS